MATSGTFTGSRGGNSYGPYLRLYWERIDVDEANNRSKLRLTLSLVSDRSLYFSSSKSGNLEGTAFTHTTGFSGTGSKTLKVKDMWVNHHSDGSYAIVLNGTFDLGVSWDGSWISSLSVSGTATLDDIPRASDLLSFTLSNTTLNKDTATTINYSIDRKSSAFTQYFELRYASTVIASWTDSGTGSRTRTLYASEVNDIIQQMPNHVSASIRLYMQTKSGSSNIGSEKYIIEGVSLNTAIKPLANNLVYYIAGTGRDKDINKYIQNLSKVTASFSASPGYGATTAVTKIVVKRLSDNANSQTISGTSGTLPKPFLLSGTYVIEGYIEDSRGRTDTVAATIVVEAYSPPKITKMTANRKLSPTTTVDAILQGSWNAMGGSNPADVLLKSVDSNGVETTLYSLAQNTTGTLNTTQNITGQQDSKSYAYILTITDSFGSSTRADAMVGTSFMEFTIQQGMGIGVGKIHERGALDVNGDAYIVGRIRVGNYDLVNEDLVNPRGLELNEGLYIRNGYLDIHSYAPVYGDGRAQIYYDHSEKKLKIYGRDAQYSGTDISIDFPQGGGIVQAPWNLAGNLLNGWANYSSSAGGFARLAYRKTTHGTVQIVGLIRNGTPGNIFLLPSTYRPNSTHIFACAIGGNAVGRVDVGSDGYVKYNGSSGVSTSFVAINIEFPLDNP